MADIKDKILSKYNINIDTVNILSLYKIDSSHLSSGELDEKIEACRRKWNQSINGANEKFAERDRIHLSNADTYEEILKNQKFRNELFDYYQKSKESTSKLSFAREYFKIVGDTKKIGKQDVEFFFDFYQEERKNKKDILEMLKKDFKVVFLGNNETLDGGENEVVGIMKNPKSPLITNLFQEATILKIKKCDTFVQTASKSEDVKNRYPKICDGLFEFLELAQYKDLGELSESIAKKREEAANYRLDRGQDFTSVVDLFNTMVELLTYKDVVDNYSEFILLMKYPKLNSYMYAFDEIKPSTLKTFYQHANTEYSFRDLNDFILNYFKPVYDNFGIYDRGIGILLKKAEKRAKSNKVLNKIDDTLGFKRTKKVPPGASIIHYMVYWPIYLTYFIFEISKLVINYMRFLAYPLFGVLLVIWNRIGPDELELGKAAALRHLLKVKDLLPVLERFMGRPMGNGFETFFAAVCLVCYIVLIYVVPPLLIAFFFYRFSVVLRKSIDWIGLERTIKGILNTLKMKTSEQHKASKNVFYKKKVFGCFINLICVAIAAVAIYYIPIGLNWVSKATGYGQEMDYGKSAENEELAEDSEETKTTDQEKVTFIEITPKSANIRSGAGTDHDVVKVVKSGQQFRYTGNSKKASNQKIWYEIYLDEDLTKSAWVNETVMKFVEE